MNNSSNQEIKWVPAPPADISIRTMESDIKSLARSGGQATAPEILSVSQDDESEARQKSDILGYGGPEKGIFTAAATVRMKESARESFREKTETSGSGLKLVKTIIILVGVLIVVAGFGLLGYYIIFPWLFR